jgi:hypothetical protein
MGATDLCVAAPRQGLDARCLIALVHKCRQRTDAGTVSSFQLELSCQRLIFTAYHTPNLRVTFARQL